MKSPKNQEHIYFFKSYLYRFWKLQQQKDVLLKKCINYSLSKAGGRIACIYFTFIGSFIFFSDVFLLSFYRKTRPNSRASGPWWLLNKLNKCVGKSKSLHIKNNCTTRRTDWQTGYWVAWTRPKRKSETNNHWSNLFLWKWRRQGK